MEEDKRDDDEGSDVELEVTRARELARPISNLADP